MGITRAAVRRTAETRLYPSNRFSACSLLPAVTPAVSKLYKVDDIYDWLENLAVRTHLPNAYTKSDWWGQRVDGYRDTLQPFIDGITVVAELGNGRGYCKQKAAVQQTTVEPIAINKVQPRLNQHVEEACAPRM